MQAVPPGYYIVWKYRDHKNGGGLAIILKEDVQCCIKPAHIADYESISFALNLSPITTFTRIVLNRPLGLSWNFLHSLPEVTAYLANTRAHFVVLGDFRRL